MRQGSIMSPKLFAMYVDDLTQSFIKRKIGCMLDEVITTFLFAMNTVSNTMLFTTH